MIKADRFLSTLRLITNPRIARVSLISMGIIPRGLLRVGHSREGENPVGGIFSLDTRLRGCDSCDDSSDTPQLAAEEFIFFGNRKAPFGALCFIGV